MDHFIGFAGGGGRRSAGGATPSCRRRSASTSLINQRKDVDGGPSPTMTLKRRRRKVDVSAGWYQPLKRLPLSEIQAWFARGGDPNAIDHRDLLADLRRETPGPAWTRGKAAVGLRSAVREIASGYRCVHRRPGLGRNPPRYRP